MKVPWTALLRYREIWPFVIGKFITDPVWWFYLFWLPSYLERERGQNPLKSALWIGVIYTGSIDRLDFRRLALEHADQARLDGRQGAHDHDDAGRGVHAGLHPRVLR